MASLALLNEAPKLADEQRVMALETVERWTTIAAEHPPAAPIALDLRGQARDQLGRKAEAKADFAAVLELHEQQPAEKPDLMVAYSAYRLALIQRYEEEDIAAALTTVQRGQALLEREWTRSGQAPELGELYQNARADLQAYELDLYLNSPELYATALKKFESAVAEQPDNAIMLLAYAQLLEKSDEEQAIALYRRAIELGGSSEFMARFNLGALYVSRAAAHSKVANEATSDAEYLPAMEEMSVAMEAAKPHLQRALELEPGDRETLRALQQVCITTEDMACYQDAKSRLDALP